MLKALKKLLKRFNIIASVPKHLIPNGRGVDKPFQDTCKLYRGFEPQDISHVDGKIMTERINFPDFSCNWNKYSSPEDVRYRVADRENDGCYSVTAEIVRYDDRATPIHDPLNDKPWYNYAHVEVRALREEEDPKTCEPPKKRKLGGSRARKLKYRDNFASLASIEVEPRPIKA